MTSSWLKINVSVLMSLFVIGTTVLAQEDTCPAIVQAALDATDEQCSATGRNQACYGNINLEAIPQAGVDDFTFSTPGDMVSVSAVGSLSLSSRVAEAGEWGIALLQLQANLPDTVPGQNVTFLLFGAVEIENAVENDVEPITFNIVAQGDSSVRSGPSAEDAEVSVLAAGDTVTAIGRNADGSWLQVSLADGSTGWIAAEEVVPDGDISTLNMTAPILNPMQAFYFSSGTGDAPCAEAPDSGILVQTPEGVGEIQFIVNEVSVTLGSTAYLQAQPSGEMTTSVVEGEATVTAGGASVVVPAGSFVSVPLNAQGQAAGTPSQPQPYNPTQMAVLPIRILPRDITIAAPISAGGGAIIPAAGEWAWTMGVPSQDAGCPPGSVELVAAVFTPRGPFRLPGDEFSMATLFDAAFNQGGPPPGAELTSPDPNTYVLDFSDGTMNSHYEVRVIDSEYIEGQLGSTGQGCTMAIPFTVALVGESTAGGIIPAAGEWQWITGAPSDEGCPGVGEAAATAYTPGGTFRLPGDEFSLELFFTAAWSEPFQPPDAIYSQPEPNTYQVDFVSETGNGTYIAQVTDTSHIVGEIRFAGSGTDAGCSFVVPFEVTRIGD